MSSGRYLNEAIFKKMFFCYKECEHFISLMGKEHLFGVGANIIISS